MGISPSGHFGHHVAQRVGLDFKNGLVIVLFHLQCLKAKIVLVNDMK